MMPSSQRKDGALTKDLVCDLRGGNFTKAGQRETKCEGLPCTQILSMVIDRYWSPAQDLGRNQVASP